MSRREPFGVLRDIGAQKDGIRFMEISAEEACILIEGYAKDVSLYRTPAQLQRLSELAAFAACPRRKQTLAHGEELLQKENPFPETKLDPPYGRASEWNLKFVIGMLENLAEGEHRYIACVHPFVITKRFLTPKEYAGKKTSSGTSRKEVGL